MSGQGESALRGEHPDHPGWQEFRVGEPQQFSRTVIGLLLVRREDDAQARVRMFLRPHHQNLYGKIHGGAVQAFIDVTLFAGTTLLRETDMSGAITLEVNTHFTGAGDPARPLDALVEIMRETGKLIFCRGSVVQDNNVIAAFSAILRKVTPR